jgi:hypothetical protein
MLGVVSELRRVIFELGFWVSGMFLIFAISKWWGVVFGAVACVRFAASYYDQVRDEKGTERDIEQYFGELSVRPSVTRQMLIVSPFPA